MADNNTIARPYARAIFDIAQAGGLLEELSGSLGVGKDILADGRVTKFLSSPSLTNEERLAFLTELFAATAGAESVFSGMSDYGTNFLKLLLEYGRLDVLPEISERFNALKAEAENTVDVTIISASELGDAQVQEIQSALKSRLGRDIILSTEIDEHLLGGAVICAGDIVIDGSVRARLEGLASTLVS